MLYSWQDYNTCQPPWDLRLEQVQHLILGRAVARASLGYQKLPLYTVAASFSSRQLSQYPNYGTQATIFQTF